jgi:1,4-alpha-glucan branching enzyme
MAQKPNTRKTSKPAASAKAVSAAKPAKPTKPVTRAATSPAKAAKAPVKAKPAPAKPVNPTQKITFTYFAPQAGSVLVAGDFTDWTASPIRLLKEESGNWKTTVALKPGKYQYRLLVDGQWQNDPGCTDVQANEFGSANCILSVAA